MTIYDYEDRAHEIDLEGFPEVIHVKVISGDEVIVVNGKVYDSNTTRCVDFLDDEYDVFDLFEIEQWMNFRPNLSDPLPVSYQRAQYCTGRW